MAGLIIGAIVLLLGGVICIHGLYKGFQELRKWLAR